MIRVCISSVTSEREFNPDIHCGVVDVTARKPCTRSLTCKVSSLSALFYDRHKTVPAYNALVTRSRYSTFNYIVLIRIPSVCVSGYELGKSEAEGDTLVVSLLRGSHLTVRFLGVYPI